MIPPKSRFKRLRVGLLEFYHNNTPIVQTAFILLAAALAIGSVFLYVHWTRGDPLAESDDVPLTAQLALRGRDIPELRMREIIELTYAAHGGRQSIDRITSFMRRGVLEVGPESWDVTYAYKRPHRIAYTLEMPRRTLRILFDGESGWRQWVTPQRTWPAESLVAAEAAVMGFNARLSEPLTVYLSDLIRLELLADSEIDGVMCHIIRWRGDGGLTIDFAIDAATFLVRQRHRSDPLPDSEFAGAITARYGDYRPVGNTRLPFEEIVLRDGVHENRMVIHEWTINPGILDNYFRPLDVR
jgi:hypothetical protein